MRRGGRWRALISFSLPPLLLIGAALLADQLAPFDPYAQDLSKALQAPDEVHLLGTDRYGRDLLSRILVGGRTTLGTALALLGVILVGGSAVGMISGYWGGRVDAFLMRLADVFLAFPTMVLAIAAAAVLGGGVYGAALALALVAWPKYARLARGIVLTIRRQPYMAAARMSGASWQDVLGSYIVPLAAGPLLVTAVLDIGMLVMELAGLSFLGLGAAPPLPEWGSMMAGSRSLLQTAPWVILAPGGALFITVAAFNLWGDCLRDVLDPQQYEEE